MDRNRDSRPAKGSGRSARPHGASRSSTMTTETTNNQTNGRSASGSSPRAPPLSRHSTHQYHHSHCGTSPSSGGPPSRMSNEAREESRQTTPAPGSSLLQERLQSLRKAESKRTGSGVNLSSSLNDARDGNMQNSPLRRSNTATGRQLQSKEDDEPIEPSGFSVREIEQTLSTLHKQNFDLKLELFHRRDRQDALEERNRVLESERHELNDMNDKLVAELETRDKAVEEAVGMIVQLEARVEELLREREMVRQVEADGTFFLPRDDQSDASGMTETPRLDSFSTAPPIDEAKVLGRMPSFLSERSDHTENLRNVLLSNRDSLAQLRRVSESSADPSEFNRVISPSLSVLSESSFTSVYGNKYAIGVESTPRPAQVGSPGCDRIEGSATSAKEFGKESWGKWESGNTPRRNSNGTPRQAGSLTRTKQQLTEILATDSPLQILERKLSMAGVSSRSSTPSHGRLTDKSPAGGLTKMGSQPKTKQEKRDALRRVATGSPTSMDHPTSDKLPPTPDTISTSTLRRCQDSNDALRSDSGSARQGSFPGGDARTATGTSVRTSRGTDDATSQAATTTAFTSRKLPLHDFQNGFLNYHRLADHLPARPRSADETTVSRRHSESWASDLESDGGDDLRTDDSNFDYWMRESNKDGALDMPNQPRIKRSTSPDLFSFPMNSGRWETDALFGAMRGDGFMQSPVSSLKRDPLDLAAYLPSPQPGVPQPPDRRSSLLAHTGNATNNGMSPKSGKLLKSPARGGNLARIGERARSNSIDSAAGLATRTKMSSRNHDEGISQRRQYPPVTGHPPRPKGLGALIRRSLGHESHSLPPSASDGMFPSNALKAGRSGRSSVPPPDTVSWAPSSSAGPDDELTRATPPPIMRNRAAAQPSDHAALPLRPQSEGGPGKLASSISTTIGGQNANGGKRKWLGGLSRMTGSKKSAG